MTQMTLREVLETIAIGLAGGVLGAIVVQWAMGRWP